MNSKWITVTSGWNKNYLSLKDTHSLLVPDLDCNLISVSKLNLDLLCETEFFAKSCAFQD